MKLKSDVLQSVLFFAMTAMLALIVLAQANPATELPKRDYGFYVYIGEQIIHGKLPYVDAWDSKPPAIFYLNAVALWGGRGSRWGVWIVEYVFLFGAICLSFYLLKKLWGIFPALFGTLVWLAGLDLTLQGGNFTEEYPLLFHFLALILFIQLIENPQNRIFNVILGLTFSTSFLFRPNNALPEAILILTLALNQIIRRNLRGFFTHFAWITLGVLAPVLIVCGYFWFQGIFQEMFDAAILHNLAYSNASFNGASPLIAGFRYLRWSAWIAALGYVVAFFYLKKSFGSLTFFALIFIVIGFPITIALSDLAGRNYGHYFINWLPFIALAGGFTIYALGDIFSSVARFFQATSSYAFAFVFVLAAGFLVASGRGTQYQKTVERVLSGKNIEMRSPTAIYVENHTRPDEYVLFWAALPGENFMANREAPYSTLFYPDLVESDSTKQLSDDFLQDIKKNSPVLIVDMGHSNPLSLDPQKRAEQRKMGLGWRFPPHNLDEVFTFIEKNYFLTAEIKGKSIYRLHGTKPP